jgi:hypothetical protein
MTALPALPSRLRRSRCRPPTWRPRHHSPVRRRRQPRARPTGATSPPFASGASARALTHCRPRQRAWRPIWRTKLSEDRLPAPSLAAALRSGTPTGLPIWSRQQRRSTFGRRYAAFGGPSAPHPPVEPPCLPSRPAPWPMPPQPSEGPSRPGAAVAGLCGRIPPLGARGPRCRRSSGNR